MTKLPQISGRECVRALIKAGFYISRQKGSHIIMRRDDPPGRVVVPHHPELHKGTLRAIIREAGLTVDELVELL